MAHAFAKPTRRAVRPSRRRETPTDIARQLGPCVYAVRTDDGLVKIGHSTDLANRIKAYGGWDALLVAVPGTRDDEASLHQQFAKHRAHGREFYTPHAEVMAFVNERRIRMGLAAV